MAHPGMSSPWVSLARALSKLGFCSRKLGRELIVSGRVRVNGELCRDPDCRVNLRQHRIEVDSHSVQPAHKVYLMLNKPRGLVTTASDEQGRPTVFECLKNAGLPALSPVGRLDKASEGLLLFTNDTAWAAHITDPHPGLEKLYHVQLDRIADPDLIQRMERGVSFEGELLRLKRAAVLRHGSRNSWLQIVLTEGKNRHIRRLLAAFGIETLRLVRIKIGSLELGDLPKGSFRHLTNKEIQELGNPGSAGVASQ
jgi:23S rRNA pseudouridine2605 synthase